MSEQLNKDLEEITELGDKAIESGRNAIVAKLTCIIIYAILIASFLITRFVTDINPTVYNIWFYAGVGISAILFISAIVLLIKVIIAHNRVKKLKTGVDFLNNILKGDDPSAG